MTNKMSIVSIKQIFMDFIDDLQTLSKKYSIGLTEVDLMFCKAYVSALPEDNLYNSTITNILPYKEQIKDRNIKFFQDQKGNIFKGLPEEKLAKMEEAITKGLIPKDAVNAIWDHIEVILLVTEMYNQRK